MIVDLFLVFQFIKRLSTPFKDWDAYKLGIIDEKGTQLIKRKDFTKRDQKDAFGIFDIMIMKLKRLLEKIPGGKSRIGSYAAALYLIKEQESINASGIDLIESYSEDELEETLTKYIESVQIEESNMDIDQLFEDMFDENSIGTGTSDVAGAGSDETVMTPDAVKRYKKKNKSVKRFKDTI
tara:strand:- start:1779 stop:2321 length:543 start_codon:yes stop_codon:yes gene_type:complete